MNIIKKYATNSDCYKYAGNITVKGLMLHSVGCNQPRAEVFANFWMNSTDVCCHGVLQADGTVYQTLPWNHKGWHCGSLANSTHIGVEMTEPSQIHYTSGANFTCSDKAAAIEQVKGTYKTAVELFAYLCKEYNLDPLKDGVIVSHNEGYKRGIASGHADPEHLWNQLGTGLTMNGFRQDVAKAMGKATTPTPNIPAQEKLYRVRKSWNDVASQIGAYRSLDSAKSICKEGYFVFDETGKAVYPEVKAEPVVTKTYCNPKIRTLKKGDKGEAVKALQIMLMALGYSVGSTGADSDFGTATETAVKKFQSDNKLTSDGVAGADTWSTLIAKL